MAAQWLKNTVLWYVSELSTVSLPSSLQSLLHQVGCVRGTSSLWVFLFPPNGPVLLWKTRTSLFTRAESLKQKTDCTIFFMTAHDWSNILNLLSRNQVVRTVSYFIHQDSTWEIFSNGMNKLTNQKAKQNPTKKPNQNRALCLLTTSASARDDFAFVQCFQAQADVV